MYRIKSIIKESLNLWKCLVNSLPDNCIVHYSANVRKSILGGYNKISRGANIFGTTMGFASYIGGNSLLPGCEIGKFCSIAANVRLIAGQHPTRGFVSSHPAFYSVADIFPLSYVTRQKFDEFRLLSGELNAIIGNDVWIGSNVIILQGVTIGDGAIIGAGAIVTHDIPPYAIAVGIPAKIIRYRFDEDEIQFLLNLKWWNRDRDWIERAGDYFDSVETLKRFLSQTEGEYN